MRVQSVGAVVRWPESGVTITEVSRSSYALYSISETSRAPFWARIERSTKTGTPPSHFATGHEGGC